MQRPDLVNGFGAARRGVPSIEPGDGIVWYAVRHGVIFGVAVVTADPDLRNARPWQGTRWPWWIATRTEFVISDLRDAPTLEEAGLASVRATQGS